MAIVLRNRDNLAEMEQFEHETERLAEERRAARTKATKKKNFTLPFHKQVAACTKRQFLVMVGDKQSLGGGHYARAWTTWLAGCGVKGGRVIGKVDDRGGEVTYRPVNAQEFLATMCHALGIDHHKEYQSREGRPMTFLGKAAKPVAEAF